MYPSLLPAASLKVVAGGGSRIGGAAACTHTVHMQQKGEKRGEAEVRCVRVLVDLQNFRPMAV